MNVTVTKVAKEHDSDRIGVLLVGHGTRETAGIRQFHEFASELISNLPHSDLAVSFLEFAQPGIASGFARLAEQGAKRIVVVPVMLFAAAHVKQDIPKAIAEIACRFPHVDFCITDHLGLHPGVIELSRQRALAAIRGRQDELSSDTCLVIVGRGSKDETATKEMLDFAEIRSDPAMAAVTQCCFVAMAKPSLEETLTRIGGEKFRRVVVQPHLLFEGSLTKRIRDLVARFDLECPATEWITTDVLGVDQRLVQAILDRISSVASTKTGLS